MCKWERTESVLCLHHLHKICNDPRPFILQFESSAFLFFRLWQACFISKPAMVNHAIIQPPVLLSGKGLTAELQQDTLVFDLRQI